MDDEHENGGRERYPKMSQEDVDRIMFKVARGGRSSCFWWFYDHFDAMRNPDGKLRMTWRECSASLNALGVTALRGRPLTPETAKKTWKKVVEKKQQDAALKKPWPGAVPIELDTVH